MRSILIFFKNLDFPFIFAILFFVAFVHYLFFEKVYVSSNLTFYSIIISYLGYGFGRLKGIEIQKQIDSDQIKVLQEKHSKLYLHSKKDKDDKTMI